VNAGLIVQGIVGGAVSGVSVAVGGYLKNAGAEFSWRNFGETVVEGAIVGGVAGALGVSYAAAQDYLVSIGVVTLIDYAKKTLVRRVWPWLKKKLGAA
jgi:hypothetical protein